MRLPTRDCCWSQPLVYEHTVTVLCCLLKWSWSLLLMQPLKRTARCFWGWARVQGWFIVASTSLPFCMQAADDFAGAELYFGMMILWEQSYQGHVWQNSRVRQTLTCLSMAFEAEVGWDDRWHGAQWSKYSKPGDTFQTDKIARRHCWRKWRNWKTRLFSSFSSAPVWSLQVKIFTTLNVMFWWL
jgi:hypothetical protein